MARFDFGDAFSRPWGLVFGNFARYATTQGVFVVAAGVLNLAATLLFLATVDVAALYSQFQATQDPAVVLAALGPLFAWGIPIALAGLALGVVGFGIGTVVTHALLNGETVSLGAAWARLKPRLGHLVLVTLAILGLVVGLAIVGGLLGVVTFGIGIAVAVALAIWLLLRWALSGVVAVLETLSVGESFAASARYVDGSKGMLFLIVLLFGVIFAAASAALTAPFAGPMDFDPDAVPPPRSTAEAVGESVVTTLVALVSGPVSAALLVVLHRALARPASPPGDAYFPATPPPPPAPPESQL